MTGPRVSPEFTARELEDELVLLHRPTGEVFTLSRVAAILWYHCDGTRSEDEVLSTVAALFPDSGDVSGDLAEALAFFRARGIVVSPADAP